MNESLPDANVGACSRQCLDRGPCTGMEYGGGVIALITIPSAFIVFFNVTKVLTSVHIKNCAQYSTHPQITNSDSRLNDVKHLLQALAQVHALPKIMVAMMYRVAFARNCNAMFTNLIKLKPEIELLKKAKKIYPSAAEHTYTGLRNAARKVQQRVRGATRGSNGLSNSKTANQTSVTLNLKSDPTLTISYSP